MMTKVLLNIHNKDVQLQQIKTKHSKVYREQLYYEEAVRPNVLFTL